MSESACAIDINDAVRIEELMQHLAEEYEPGMPSALLREHLEAARFYLLGGMPQEYHFTLELLKELLPDIEDKSLGARVADFLHSGGAIAASPVDGTV